jgi:hypothetical protein
LVPQPKTQTHPTNNNRKHEQRDKPIASTKASNPIGTARSQKTEKKSSFVLHPISTDRAADAAAWKSHSEAHRHRADGRRGGQSAARRSVTSASSSRHTSERKKKKKKCWLS